MSTALQAFLRGGGTLEDLEARYAIKSVRHRTHPNLMLFKYSQIASPMEERIVQEARGIILDSGSDWACVARGFDKFFNYGEALAAEIDWATARVQEKVDGSLCMLYWYDGRYHIATTGSPDAAGSVWGSSFSSFAGLFWHAWDQCNPKNRPGPYRESAAFLFELTTPYNRVVVPHQECRVTLLAARERTGQWWWREEVQEAAAHLRVSVVHEFALQHLNDLLDSFLYVDGTSREGYVVVDAQNRRIKVKHPQYVTLHHLKSAASPRAFVEVIQRGETAEATTYFPELAEEFRAIRARFDSAAADIDRQWDDVIRLCDWPSDRKNFALCAKQVSAFPAPLFNRLDGRCKNGADFLRTARTDLVMQLLGLKDRAPSEEADA